MKRLVYIGYYLKNMNWKLLARFIHFANENYDQSKIKMTMAMFYNALRYNISLLEYFQFFFFNKTSNEKTYWAGTGFMYEYQLKMNPLDKRDILDDKRKFYKSYKNFFVHTVADLNDLINDTSLGQKILANSSGKIVFKVADGKCGKQVCIRNSNEFTVNSLINFLKDSDYDMVEEYLIQHDELQKLSPSAVNTVRIFTQLNKNNEVEILGCRQRISVNSSVDNMAAGNIAAPICEVTGIIYGPAVYSDITKEDVIVHPVTQATIVGFQIPFWKETIKMVKAAALLHPQNRSIGWDIVITKNGPGLIEGNHDWCKLLWQLPVKKGLKSLLKVV